METSVLMKPHHFVDIIIHLGAKTLSLQPHPYGHSWHKVAALLLTNLETNLILTPGADDICHGCSHLIRGICNDIIDTSWRPRAPVSKYLWNLTLDGRWLDLLNLNSGRCLPAFSFCELLEKYWKRFPSVYEELPVSVVAARQQNLRKGLDFIKLHYL